MSVMSLVQLFEVSLVSCRFFYGYLVGRCSVFDVKVWARKIKSFRFVSYFIGVARGRSCSFCCSEFRSQKVKHEWFVCPIIFLWLFQMFAQRWGADFSVGQIAGVLSVCCSVADARVGNVWIADFSCAIECSGGHPLIISGWEGDHTPLLFPLRIIVLESALAPEIANAMVMEKTLSAFKKLIRLLH